MQPTVSFIVGSPRSGTTLLGNILDLHPHLAQWYEPIFVLDRYFQDAPNDRRIAQDATPKIAAQISEAFRRYRSHRRARMVVSKSPDASLKVAFLNQIFPNARYIHILRDGRDATLSINVEWQKRQNVLDRKKGVLPALRVLKRALDRQPVLAHKVQQLLFEIGSPANLFKGRGGMLYRQRRWPGRIGWGPQFLGWQDAIDAVSMLEFNAMQWAKCVEATLDDAELLVPDQYLEVRYEDLLQQPRNILAEVFDFLSVPITPDFVERMPALRRDNYNKWKAAFSAEDKARIGPILHRLLVRTGYAQDEGWYRQPI